MKFRLRAFGLHLVGSACALTLVLGALYLGWYRWPGWYLAAVLNVLAIMCLVDLALGPTLTLIVANPGKARRELTRDIAMIVTVQVAALVYGTITLWLGRPLYYAYSYDSVEMVQASDIAADERARAFADNPAFAPHWYRGVRRVWAPLPADPETASKIATGTIFGGQDVVDMPRYFKPWAEGLPELRKNLRPVGEIKYLSKAEQAAVAARIASLGASPTQANAMVMWGLQGTRPMVLLFDPESLTIRAMLKVPGRG